MKKILLRNPLALIKSRAVAITVFAAAGLLLAVACGSDAATPSRGVASPPTPDAQATITTLARTGEVGIPTPTAVPAADRAVAIAFSDGHRALSQRWDAFHSEFDVWRQGLAQCTPGAVQSALSNFAGNFAQITESARALPRSTVIRNLADDLIGAAEQEEAALRLLRDTWQPGTINNGSSAVVDDDSAADASENSSVKSNPGGVVSPFERLAAARSQAALLRRSVADSLLDRSSRTGTAAQAEIDTFSGLFQELEVVWDQFHLDYDELRTQVADLSASEAAARLGAMVTQFSDIVSAVRGLPSGDATFRITQILSQAAQEEERSLRRLRGAVQNGGESTETSAPEATEDGTNGDSDNEEVSNSSAGEAQALVDISAYDTFDSQIATSSASRAEARRSLTLAKQDISPETRSAVADFTDQYGTLTLAWNSFHSGYDEWRKTDGGCNPSLVIEDLGRFGVSFSEIANEARNLPAATVLRPMGELLVEATQREERALRDLVNTWQPYDTGVYATLDQETTAANRLRRQVTVGLQELYERFGISP